MISVDLAYRESICGFKTCVISRIARRYITYCCAAVRDHIFGNFVAVGIVPADKPVSRSRIGGGTYGNSHCVGITVTVERAYCIVIDIFPCVTVFHLTYIGLRNAVGKPCVIGLNALLCFEITVFVICCNKVSVLIIPSDKLTAALRKSLYGYPFIGFCVVGFSAVLIVRVIVILVRRIGYVHDLDRSAHGRIDKIVVL